MDFPVTGIGKYRIVKLSGKIDWTKARLLDQQVGKIIKQGFLHIVFNLEEITFICSGGIGAIVYNLNKLRKLGGAMYLISSNDYVNFLFQTLKFDIIFEGLLFESFDLFREKILDREKIVTREKSSV
jgi:anti-anti-sigma factor